MGGLTLPFAGSYDTDGTVFAITQPSSAGTAILGASYGSDPYGDTGTGIYGQSDVGSGVFGDSAEGVGVEGGSETSVGVFGFSFSGNGVWGQTDSADNAAVVGFNGGTAGQGPSAGVGVYGQGEVGVSGHGVYGMEANGQTGIQAIGSGIGVWAISDSGDAVFATTGKGIALHAHAVSGQAGHFQGDVSITGNLSKGGGGFKIDHPTDPANKYLSHSFVESPEMKNVYDGVAVLSRRGDAEVKLPAYFETLNGDFRYQLTPMGAAAPDLHIAKGVSHGRFRIAGGRAGMRVCWQVTGVRKDRWAKKHRLTVEEKKPAKHRGFYLHPELFGKPRKKQIEWANHPELMARADAAAQKRGAKKLVTARPKRNLRRAGKIGNTSQR